MLSSNKIAVTGSLSSGKTTVCNIFKDKGAYYISADAIIHKLLSNQSYLKQKIINLLGKAVIVNDELHRKKIAQKVFNNSQLLQDLEKILHPEVKKEIENEYKKFQTGQHDSLFVVEFPLLFEVGDNDCYDVVITVICDVELSQERFKKSTGYTDEEYDLRMVRQMNPKEKAKKADIVIKNNGSFEDLKQTVEQVFSNLIKSR